MSTNVIINTLGLDASKNFKSKIAKIINSKLMNDSGIEATKEIYIGHTGIALSSGYGHYEKHVSMEIDDISFDLKEHTTDSELYDFFKGNDNFNQTYSNAIKNLVIDVIEANINRIADKVFESKEN